MQAKRLTIGFLIDWIENPYHFTLLSGIDDAAKELNANILVYVGGTPNSQVPTEVRRTIIYNFIGKNIVDGLIIAAGSVGRCSTLEELEVFCKKYLPLPIVTIAQRVADFPVIRADGKQGFKELIRHLIDRHNKKKLAYISGPGKSQDSIERFEAFTEVLKEKNIPIIDGSVVTGSFVLESGTNAVRILIDERHIDFDAIVAANDDMAVGAIQELQFRGYTIPDDCAVIGFDNQDIYKYLTPPLTTVQQPIYSLGVIAVKTLIKKMNGENVTDILSQPTSVVIRESCGCKPEPFHFKIYNSPESKSTNIDIEQISTYIFENIENLLSFSGNSNTRSSVTPSQISSLVHSFYDEIESEQCTGFINHIQILLNELNASEIPQTKIQSIVTYLKDSLITHLPSETLRCKTWQVFDYIRRYASKLAEEIQGKNNVMTKREILTFRTRIENMMEELNIDSFLNDLELIFKDIQVISFYIARYVNLDLNSLQKTQFKFFFAYKKGKRLKVTGDEHVCPVIDVLPTSYLPKKRRFFIIIEPLFTGKEQFGCAFMELPVHKEIVLNMMLRTLMYNMLRNTLFIQKLQDQSERLHKKTDELTTMNKMLQKLLIARERNEEEVRKLNEELEERVKIRTKELDLANKNLTITLNELTQMQKELVESEKLAALGSLVAGIAHEINTPIGIGVTAASHLEKQTKLLFAQLLDQKIKKKDLSLYMDTAQEASAMILSNLKRAYELIRSFKDVAVDQSSEKLREFNMKSYIHDVLLSLRPRLKKVNHSIHINCPEDINIKSYPGAFSQIITNLIINSLTHAFDDGDEGIISINVSTRNSVLSFIYTDNGKGIDKENILRVFEPFFTTNRKNGGTGLGMHLVYNIVKQQLGGTITCKSETGKGVCFTITVPLRNHKTENGI